jgi:DASS family divalent anion:Na+ symporter
VSCSLILTDLVLAGSIPSITARNAGIILPITRGIAELYGSTPGATAARLGTFLMAAIHQGSVIACAMFMTGQASNLLAATLAARTAGVTVTWTSWFVAGLVPGLASVLVIPALVHRALPPEVKHTPAATAYAREALARMGPLRGTERLVSSS